jgi:hypothetical protein
VFAGFEKIAFGGLKKIVVEQFIKGALALERFRACVPIDNVNF